MAMDKTILEGFKGSHAVVKSMQVRIWAFVRVVLLLVQICSAPLVTRSISLHHWVPAFALFYQTCLS